MLTHDVDLRGKCKCPGRMADVLALEEGDHIIPAGPMCSVDCPCWCHEFHDHVWTRLFVRPWASPENEQVVACCTLCRVVQCARLHWCVPDVGVEPDEFEPQLATAEQCGRVFKHTGPHRFPSLWSTPGEPDL